MAALAESGTVTTVNGSDLSIEIDGELITVNGAPVVCGNVQTANATVHIIDQVLVPSAQKTIGPTRKVGCASTRPFSCSDYEARWPSTALSASRLGLGSGRRRSGRTSRKQAPPRILERS